MTDEPIGFNDTPPALRATSKNRNRKKRTPLYIRHIVRAAQLANSEIAIKKALELKQIYHSGKHVTTDMADAVCNEVLMRCATKGSVMLEEEGLTPAKLAFITGAVAQVKKAVGEKEAAQSNTINIFADEERSRAILDKLGLGAKTIDVEAVE